MQKLWVFLELLVLAGAGALAALTIDFNISADGSLLHGAAQYIDAAGAQINAPQIPFRVVAAILVLTGALSVNYLRPLTRKGAFACGFATIATLAIFVP